MPSATLGAGSVAPAGAVLSFVFPLGGGPRVYIGESFAWMKGVLALATIAQRHRLHLALGHAAAAEPLITLRPKGGMAMLVEPRMAASHEFTLQRQLREVWCPPTSAT